MSVSCGMEGRNGRGMQFMCVFVCVCLCVRACVCLQSLCADNVFRLGSRVKVG